MQSNAIKEPPAPRQGRSSFADIKSMSFEAALKELEQMLARLERGDVELEQSIEIYERGAALRAHCHQLLKRAEAKVERITLSAQGIPSGTAPLDPGPNGAP